MTLTNRQDDENRTTQIRCAAELGSRKELETSISLLFSKSSRSLPDEGHHTGTQSVPQEGSGCYCTGAGAVARRAQGAARDRVGGCRLRTQARTRTLHKPQKSIVFTQRHKFHPFVKEPSTTETQAATGQTAQGSGNRRSPECPQQRDGRPLPGAMCMPTGRRTRRLGPATRLRLIHGAKVLPCNEE